MTPKIIPVDLHVQGISQLVKVQLLINRPRTSSIYGCKRINSAEDDSNENMDTDMAFDDS